MAETAEPEWRQPTACGLSWLGAGWQQRGGRDDVRSAPRAQVAVLRNRFSEARLVGVRRALFSCLDVENVHGAPALVRADSGGAEVGALYALLGQRRRPGGTIQRGAPW